MLLGPYFGTVAIALALEAQGTRYLVLIRTHVVPVTILATEGASNERTHSCLCWMTQLAAYMASTRTVLDDHIVKLEG